LPAGFIGRKAELSLLHRRLSRVKTSGTGTALAIRGRRQVGKSRLAQEFCDGAGVPYLFYTAAKGTSPVMAIASFLAELSESGLPRDLGLVPAEPVASWPEAFRVLAAVLPDTPVVIVLDELPWLAEQDDIFDGALQTAWDRLLSNRPVLLLLLGSDLHMMERLTAYDRPFFGRADNLLLSPLNPAEVGDALDLEAADAIDAYLLSAGLPGILRAWPDRVPAHPPRSVREHADYECGRVASRARAARRRRVTRPGQQHQSHVGNQENLPGDGHDAGTVTVTHSHQTRRRRAASPHRRPSMSG
jgi:uncharacterized protein